MKGIIFATAAITLGIGAGFVGPKLMRGLSIDINTVASHAEPQRSQPSPVTADPGGLVGAAEVQPGQRRLQMTPARTAPAATSSRVQRPAPRRQETESPAPVTTASDSVDCRRYVPEAEVTVSVPCEGKTAEKGKDDDDNKSEKKERRKSRKGSKSSQETAEDKSESEGVGMCRRYVTRAGVTVLQKVPCGGSRSGSTNRVAEASK